MDDRHARLVRQLYREYDAIVYHFGLPAMRAVLHVQPMKAHWGRWDPQTRTITLSTQLIDGYAWDVVVEVLKHEMAHQWASMHAPKDAPHGAAFARACRMLGMAAWSAACTGALPTTCPPGEHRLVSDEERRLLDKVEKLLNLATSSNEHEAGLAMQRARQLLARYNLDRTAAPAQEDLTYVVVHRHKRRTSRIEAMVVALLVEHFHVRAVHTKVFDSEHLCEFCAVELLGEHRHVAMAEYVYHFLLNTVQDLYERYRRERRGAKVQRGAYMIGVMLGFGEKLACADAADAPAPSPDARALVRTTQQRLRSFVSYRHPKLSARRMTGQRLDARTLDAGKKAGHKIVLNRAITGQTSQRGRLLSSGC